MHQLPYFIDLHVFLGRGVQIAGSSGIDEDTDGVLGKIPQQTVDVAVEETRVLIAHNTDLQSQLRVIYNAYKLYDRCVV